MPEKLLTLPALAAESGIPLKTLYGCCAPAGDLPVIRFSRRRIYVQRDDWTAWLERHRTAPIDHAQIEVANRRHSVRELPGAGRYVS
jgi:hypothetical protein